MSDTNGVNPEAVLEVIPDPETVRRSLGRTIRQAALLRSLLRVAVRKADYPEATEKQESREVSRDA